jgi:hypothetical protein
VLQETQHQMVASRELQSPLRMKPYCASTGDTLGLRPRLRPHAHQRRPPQQEPRRAGPLPIYHRLQCRVDGAARA